MSLGAFFSTLIGEYNTVVPLPDLPQNGLLVHLQPSGIEHSGGEVTGWRNEVTNAMILPANGAKPLYNASDASFNNSPSISIGPNGQLYGIPVSSSEGLTIIVVARLATLNEEPAQNGDGSMWWYMQDEGGARPFDLWSSNYVSVFYNTFGGSYFGHDFGMDQRIGAAVVMTSMVSNNNILASRLYKNGLQLVINTNNNAINQVNTENLFFFPGWVPASPNYSFLGRQTHILIWGRLLDSGELDAAHTFLKTKYGIS